MDSNNNVSIRIHCTILMQDDRRILALDIWEIYAIFTNFLNSNTIMKQVNLKKIFKEKDNLFTCHVKEVNDMKIKWEN